MFIMLVIMLFYENIFFLVNIKWVWIFVFWVIWVFKFIRGFKIYFCSMMYIKCFDIGDVYFFWDIFRIIVDVYGVGIFNIGVFGYRNCWGL